MNDSVKRTDEPCKHPLPDLGRFEVDVCHACGVLPTPHSLAKELPT